MHDTFFIWLPFLGMILVGSTLLAGGVIGIYNAFIQIYGYPIQYICFYSMKKLDLDKIIFGVLRTEMFGFLGIFTLFIIGSGEFTFGAISPVCVVLAATCLGGLLGILHPILTERLMASKIKRFLTNKDIVELSSGSLLGGMIGGLFVGGLFISEIHLFYSEANLFRDGEFLGVLFGIYTIIGAMFGATGVFACLIARIVSQIVSPIISTVFIPLRFKTSLCDNCFRYNDPLDSTYNLDPLDSTYNLGRRYCQYCQQEIPWTEEQGKVIITFGDIPSIDPGRENIGFYESRIRTEGTAD